ncbi:MAG: hypothetical protein ACI3T9_06740 [Romboutsia timonensis]
MPFLPSSLSDHPSLVGIIRLPSCSYKSSSMKIPCLTQDPVEHDKFITVSQVVDMADSITSKSVTSESVTIPKNKVTDFYPYTYYVLTDGESEPLIMYPQYMNDTLSVKGVFALSHQPVERYYPSYYKGDSSGKVYNITNINQMMLPTATNEGINYMSANANTMAQNRKTTNSNITYGVIGSTIALAGGIATGNPIAIAGGVAGLGTSLASGINQIKQIDSRNKDITMTPTSITSYGTPSTRQAFNTDSVRLIKYTVKDSVKNKINDFNKRYGNKLNNYKEIDLKTYKGYIKYVSPDVDSKIDNMFIDKIIEILERGVYIE